MQKALLFAALFGCLLALSVAEDGQGDTTDDTTDDGEIPAEAGPENDEEPNKVKGDAAAGHFGGFHRRFRHRRRFHGGHGRGREIERSTCSVQASYWLSVNRERRYCIDAIQEHDDCQACCEAATRRETRGVDTDDVTGFITVGGLHGPGPYRGKREASGYKGNEVRIVREKECVCCIPNKHQHHGHHGGYYGGYY